MLMKPYVVVSRAIISFLNSFKQVHSYRKKNCCVSMGACPCKLGLGMDVRWKTTYLMIKHLIYIRAHFQYLSILTITCMRVRN